MLIPFSIEMPIYFWNDNNEEKYRSAYFETFKGIWHHGDFISISEYGSITIYGRSDATLNPGGVRIGTAEIYRVVEAIEFIEDSLVIGQEWKGDQRVLLFVIMKSGFGLDSKKVEQIKSDIDQIAHIGMAEKVIETKGIPYTINGKKVEIAVKILFRVKT